MQKDLQKYFRLVMAMVISEPELNGGSFKLYCDSGDIVIRFYENGLESCSGLMSIEDGKVKILNGKDEMFLNSLRLLTEV